VLSATLRPLCYAAAMWQKVQFFGIAILMAVVTFWAIVIKGQ
jgi:hypothetical protein